MVGTVIIVVLPLLALAGLILLVIDPGYKKLKTKNALLQLEVDKLNQQIQEKDKELQARRLGLPWIDTQ